MNIKYKVKADVHFRANSKLETNIYADSPDEAYSKFRNQIDFILKQSGFKNYDWTWRNATISLSDDL